MAVTWEPATVTAVTLSGGNLVATNTGTTSADQGARVAAASGKTTGKYYFEVTWTTITSGVGSNSGVGVGTTASTYTNMGNGGTTGDILYVGGSIYSNAGNTGVATGSPWTAGQIVGIAVDLDNRKIWFRQSPSGNWNGNATYNPATNVGGVTIPAGTMVPFVTFGGSTGAASNVQTANFGASAFSGAVPSGFISWDAGTVPPVITPPAIRIKRRAAGGAVGAPTSLANGELAYNEQNDTLYYGKGDSGAGVATSIVAIGGGGAYQPLDATLTALAAYNTNGLLTQTAADTFTGRTLTGPAAGITVSNGNGVGGNPTLALANDLAALEALAGTNTIYYRSAADTWTAVTVGTGLSFSAGTLANTVSTTGLAPLASPAFTGDPTAPTPTAGDNDTSIATTAFVTAAIAASGSGTTTPGPPQGRLTLDSTAPVMTTNRSSQATIYYAAYVGALVPIYDGTNFAMMGVGNFISCVVSDTTKNPSAIGASKVNDWFVWNDAGTIRLGHGPDWTSDTARSAGTALGRINGVLLNSVAITNGPAAGRGTYVGTTRSNASSQLDWIFGGSGVAGFFGVWNTYNRQPVATMSLESTASWTYGSGIWRASNASAINRCTFVEGLGQGIVSANYETVIQSGASNAVGAIGIGLDATNAVAAKCTTGICQLTGLNFTATTHLVDYVPIGVHFVAALEFNNTGNASTFYGGTGANSFGGYPGFHTVFFA